MHILYIHQYFGTPKIIGGVRSYKFAKLWQDKGHKVTMLTSTCNISEQELANAKGVFFKRCDIEGINVVAANVSYNNKMNKFRRALSFAFFLAACSFYLLFMKNVDVIYATSTPLTVGIPALVGKCFKRIPYVFEVRDQWPEVPIELGIIQNKTIIKLLLWLERKICFNADAIIALSPGMAEGTKTILKGTPKIIEVIPNCSDIDTLNPDVDGSKKRQEYGWTNKQVFLHAGAISMVNGLDFIIDVAEKIKQHEEIHFVIMGRGRDKQALKDRVDSKKLNNVEFIDFIPKIEVPQYLAACDVSMVIIANYPILEHNSANKFFDSLSAGKPTLLNYSGWQRDIIEANKAGFGCKQCDLNEFVEKVLYLNSHKDQLEQMGQNGHRVAVENFARNDLAMQALDVVINSVVKS